MSSERVITVGEAADGSTVTLPVVEVLTGRGFVTGKSGSGKSNTASVIAEELLESGFPLLVVDTDGEYYGLKEEYEMLHAGADEECDVQIGPEHAEQMATLALEENVPVILDVSGYLDEDEADELLRETARQLFVKEKKLKKPFLLVVEEVHEYIPEGGGMGETGNLLIKIGKRGRKHGLGILGISQRPADVKKDFITQANWLVWHRLTWENDTKVVGRIIDREYAELVSDLDDGEAFIQTDWMDRDVHKIQFRRKRTFDAGATPGLDDFERPELKSVSEALVGELQEVSERKEREADRLDRLETELDERDRKIEELENRLSSARDVSTAAKQLADALSNPETVQSELSDSGEELRRMHEELVELEKERERKEEQRESLAAEVTALERELNRREEQLAFLEEENTTLRTKLRELQGLDSDEPEPDANEPEPDANETPIVQGDGTELEFGYTTVEESDEDLRHILVADEEHGIESLFDVPELGERLTSAVEGSRCSEDCAASILDVLIRDGPLRTGTVASRVGRSPVAVQSFLSELRTQGVLDRTEDNRYDATQELLDTVVLSRESE